MPFHHFFHQLRVQLLLTLSPESSNFIPGVAALLVIAAFLVVGLVRVVEFNDLGFSRTKRIFFYIVHGLGCVSFCLGLFIFAIDPHMVHRSVFAVFFGGGLFLLTPLQIYLGLIRRIRQKPLI